MARNDKYNRKIINPFSPENLQGLANANAEILGETAPVFGLGEEMPITGLEELVEDEQMLGPGEDMPSMDPQDPWQTTPGSEYGGYGGTGWGGGMDTDPGQHSWEQPGDWGEPSAPDLDCVYFGGGDFGQQVQCPEGCPPGSTIGTDGSCGGDDDWEHDHEEDCPWWNPNCWFDQLNDWLSNPDAFCEQYPWVCEGVDLTDMTSENFQNLVCQYFPDSEGCP